MSGGGKGRRPTITGRVARGADWRPSDDEAVTLSALPSAPAYLSAQGKAQYSLIVAELARRRAIQRSDVALIEIAASAYAEWQRLDAMIWKDDRLLTESAKGGAYLSGEAQARASAEKRYIRAVNELGVGSVAARLSTFKKAESEQPELFAWHDPEPTQTAPTDPTDPFAEHHLH